MLDKKVLVPLNTYLLASRARTDRSTSDENMFPAPSIRRHPANLFAGETTVPDRMGWTASRRSRGNGAAFGSELVELRVECPKQVGGVVS